MTFGWFCHEVTHFMKCNAMILKLPFMNKNSFLPILRHNFGIIFRAKGGVEAEREERQKWVNKERQKIQDSVNGRQNGLFKKNFENKYYHTYIDYYQELGAGVAQWLAC